jgi:hypothetical protein
MDIFYEVLRDYRQFPKADDQFDFGTLLIARFILNSITFNTPPIPITGVGTTLTSVNNDYLTRINDARGGDGDAIILRNDYRDKTWIPVVDRFARYVEEDVAEGDRDIILLSGFKPTATDKIKSEVPKKMHLEIKSNNKGEFSYRSDTKNIGKDASFVLICGSRSIANFTVTQDAVGKIIVTIDDKQIIIAPLRRKKGTVKGLPIEEKMKAIIFAINAAGAGPLSEEVNFITQ